MSTDDGELVPDHEIRRITKREQPAAQARWLKRNGVPCRHVGGVVILSRQHLREWIAGRAAGDAADNANWSAVQ